MMKLEETRTVTDSFLKELRKSLGMALKEVWLFGSRARQDDQQDSDYDMLVVAEGNLPDIREMVQDAEWHCMENLGVLVASIVYTPEIWSTAKCSPLGWNILHDGTLVA